MQKAKSSKRTRELGSNRLEKSTEVEVDEVDEEVGVQEMRDR